MKQLIFLLFLCISLLSPLKSQQITTMSFDELEPYLHRQSDSLFMIHFWATWCVPCVKEMPVIQKVANEHAHLKLSILLVSLDMPNQLETRLIPFIDKYQIKSNVVLLNDPDFNSWIDKVSTDWGGGIPATLFYSQKHRNFYEQSFEYEELNQIISTNIKEL